MEDVLNFRNVARFKCKASAGIGYAYWMRVEYKNLIEGTTLKNPIWENSWHRSDRLGSVSLGLTNYAEISEVEGLYYGAKVRYLMEVKAGTKDCTASEEFVYFPNSKYEAVYDGRESVFNPRIEYEGVAIFQNLNIDDEAVAFYRPVKSITCVDHTYCKVGDIYYKCNGNDEDSDDDEMYRGMGDTEYARQTANGEEKKNSKGMTVNDGTAGIIYGLTGVCHQIANRILWTSQIRVDKANGYSLSTFFYGEYGKGRWNPIELPEPEQSTDRHTLELYKLVAEREKGELTENEFVWATVQAYIANRMGKDFIGSHQDLMERIYDAQAKVAALDENTPASDIKGKVNALAAELQETCAKLLAADEYERLFGFKPGNIVTLL